MQRIVRKLATIATVLVITVVGVSACGGDDDDERATPSLCDDSEALESSVEDLKNVDVVENGMSSLESALGIISNDAENLITNAGDDFRTEIDAMQSALSDLRSSIENVVADGVAPVRAAVSEVEQAATDLSSKYEDAKC